MVNDDKSKERRGGEMKKEHKGGFSILTIGIIGIIILIILVALWAVYRL